MVHWLVVVVVVGNRNIMIRGVDMTMCIEYDTERHGDEP